MSYLQAEINASGVVSLHLTQKQIEDAVDHLFDYHYFSHQGTCECGQVVHNKADIPRHLKQELMRAILNGP